MLSSIFSSVATLSVVLDRCTNFGTEPSKEYFCKIILILNHRFDTRSHSKTFFYFLLLRTILFFAEEPFQQFWCWTIGKTSLQNYFEIDQSDREGWSFYYCVSFSSMECNNIVRWSEIVLAIQVYGHERDIYMTFSEIDPSG